MHGYFVASFPYFNGTVPYTSVFVTKPGAHITMWSPGFIIPLIYGYRNGNLATKYPWIYGFFYSASGKNIATVLWRRQGV